jgi:hypothetical protein
VAGLWNAPQVAPGEVKVNPEGLLRRETATKLGRDGAASEKLKK